MNSRDFFAQHPVFTHQRYLSAYLAGRERSPRTAATLLARQVASGRLLSIRRGLYAVVPPGAQPATFQVDPYLVASHLAADAVIVGHSALQFWGRSYSMWQRILVASESQLRPLSFQGFDYLGTHAKIPTAALHVPHAGGWVSVASLEQTLVDVLGDPAAAGGLEEVWRSLEMVEFFDLDLVIAATLSLDSAVAAGRVGFFLDQHREALFVEERHLAELRRHAPLQARYLDASHESGRLVKPWNMVVPQRVLHRAWEESNAFV